MAREFSRARIGLFVLVGLGLLIAALLWFGSERLFRQYDLYVTYFTQSVSGLTTSASVKFRGVIVGHVTDVLIDPQDSTRIEVLMDLRPGTPVKTDTVARLGYEGLTGIRYIELSGGTLEAARLRPPRSGQPAVIPSESGMLQNLQPELDEMVEQLSEILRNLRDFTGPDTQARVATVLDDFSRLSADLGATMAELRPQIARLGDFEQEAESVLGTARTEIERLGATARGSVAEVAGVVTESQLPATLERLDQASVELLSFAGQLNRQLRTADPGALAGDLRQSLAQLETGIEKWNELMDQIKSDPSALVFSRPQPERRLPDRSPGR